MEDTLKEAQRKGGRNSRKNLTPEERTKLARKAALARHKKAKKSHG